ncbi:MAG: PAS domain-containing protein, partial [Leptolyngbya sp.]|nr:PAS domain-containing protein [Candidatus Melainabacteria bacterium]
MMSSNASGFRVFVVGGSDADRISLQNSLDDTETVFVMAPSTELWSNSIHDFRHANCQILFLSRDAFGNSPHIALSSLRLVLPVTPLIAFGGPEDEDFRRRLIELGVVDCLASGRLTPEFVVRASKRAVSLLKTESVSESKNNTHDALLSEPLLQLSNDGIFSYDLNFKFTIWNSVMEKVFDLSKEEVIGKDAFETLPFLRDIDEDELLVAVRQGRSVMPPERPFIHPKTGRTGLFQSKYAPIKDVENNVVGILCVFKDTSRNVDRWRESGSYAEATNTELKAKIPDAVITNLLDGLLDAADLSEVSEGELDDIDISTKGIPYRERLQALKPGRNFEFNQSNTIENAPIGIWKLDDHFEITKVNATVRRQLALEDSDLIGKPIFEIVPSFQRELLSVVLDKGERVHLENQFVKSDGARESNPTYWDVAAWPLKGEDNAIVGLCLSTMEVTERQRTLQQKEDFVATLVHDLKTPLRSISSY